MSELHEKLIPIADDHMMSTGLIRRLLSENVKNTSRSLRAYDVFLEYVSELGPNVLDGNPYAEFLCFMVRHELHDLLTDSERKLLEKIENHFGDIEYALENGKIGSLFNKESGVEYELLYAYMRGGDKSELKEQFGLTRNKINNIITDSLKLAVA